MSVPQRKDNAAPLYDGHLLEIEAARAAARLPYGVLRPTRLFLRRSWRLAFSLLAIPLMAAALLTAAPSQAASERYDYDALGRLIRVIDAGGRVTEYDYDAAGNIRAVRTGGSAATLQPTITGVVPSGFRKAEAVQITVTGTNFVGARLNSADPEIDITNVAATATQFRFTASATDVAVPGTKNFTIANAAGTAAFTLTLAPQLPQATFSPQPIALPPDNTPRSFNVVLSNADTIAHTVNLTTDNAAVATVTPPSVTFAAGETSKTIQITGRIGGLTTVRTSSTTIASASAPVFVTTDFAGVRTTYAPMVGVIFDAPPVGTPLDINGLLSAAVGVTVGPYFNSLAPRALVRGQTTRLTISGGALQGVNAISILPAAGISISNLAAASDGLSVAIDVAVAADAAIVQRQLVLAGTAGPYRPSSANADRIWVVDGAPIITAIDPFQAAPGTTGITFRLYGRNLHAAERILIAPISNVRISTAFTVNSTGTEIVGGIEVPLNARVGSYPVQVETPAGISDATATPANTFVVVNEIQSVFAPIYAPLVGVSNGTPTGGTLTGPLFSESVGVTYGTAISNVAPRSGTIGQTVTLTFAGTDLTGVTAVQITPSTGLTIAAPVVTGDGRSATVNVAVAADAPRTLRRLRVVAGSETVPFTLPELANFLVTEALPEVDSVSPIALITGDPPLTFFVRGRNLQSATAMRFVPGSGITVGSNLSVNASGTEATVSITVAPTAPVGTRVAIIDTAAGSSSGVAGTTNTVTVANNVAASYNSIVAPLVGVQNGPVSGPQPITLDPIVAPLVGVLVQQTPLPGSSTYPLFTPSVGVALGAAMYQVSQTPLLAGSGGTLTITGVNLQGVTAVSVSPATGITLGSPSVNGAGTVVTVSATAGAGLSTSSRLIRVDAGAARVPFANAAQSTLFVNAAAPRIDSIDPILATVGDNVTLLIRGANFQFATAVVAEPAAGVRVTTAPVVNAAGTEATVSLQIPNDAALGARVIRIVTPGGGITTDVAAPANTFTVFPF